MEIIARFDKDTWKMHRFQIQANSEGVSGSLYISKDQKIPDTLTVRLVTGVEKQNGREGSTASD